MEFQDTSKDSDAPEQNSNVNKTPSVLPQAGSKVNNVRDTSKKAGNIHQCHIVSDHTLRLFAVPHHTIAQ